jgi:DNA-binding MarR family transcriptional regulator
MTTESSSGAFFYRVEKAIKSYRQFAQRQITESGQDITIDQWLILQALNNDPGIPLTEISTALFKDNASVSRIIQLLENRGYITRRDNETDGRRSLFSLTTPGKKTVGDLLPTIEGNRKHALRGIPSSDLASCRRVLDKIASNCQQR